MSADIKIKEPKPPTFADLLCALAIKRPQLTLYEVMDVAEFVDVVKAAFPNDPTAQKVLFLGMKALLGISISAYDVRAFSPNEAAESLENFAAEREYAASFAEQNQQEGNEND